METLDKDLMYFYCVIQRPRVVLFDFLCPKMITAGSSLPFDPSFPSSGLSWMILTMWWTVVALAYFQQEENSRSSARPQVPVDLQNYPLPRVLLVDACPLPNLKMERSESRYPERRRCCLNGFISRLNVTSVLVVISRIHRKISGRPNTKTFQAIHQNPSRWVRTT